MMPRALSHSTVAVAALFPLAACAATRGPLPGPPAAPAEVVCAAREQGRDQAERARAARAVAAVDQSYGETLLVSLRSASSDERRVALERFVRFPDLLPRRPEAFAAVAAFLDDETAWHSKRCNQAFEGSYLADGIRFEQAECMRGETTPYATLAGALLWTAGNGTPERPMADAALVAHVLDKPASADAAARWLAAHRFAFETLASASTDVQRLGLLRLTLDGSGDPAEDARVGLAPVLALLESGTVDVRVRAALVILHHPWLDAGGRAQASALALLGGALDDDRNPAVERDLSRWADHAQPLAEKMLARFTRRRTAAALHALTHVQPPPDALGPLVAALRDPRLGEDVHAECLRVLWFAGDSAAPAKAAVLDDVQRTPAHAGAAASLLARAGVEVTAPEFDALAAAYARTCSVGRGPVRFRLPENDATCAVDRESMVRLALRGGFRFVEPTR